MDSDSNGFEENVSTVEVLDSGESGNDDTPKDISEDLDPSVHFTSGKCSWDEGSCRVLDLLA